ncbi:MAG: type II toxin-antitoxin system PemK/MazF family toxin [Clostridiales Family XIII bacterium]|jgi:mRNA interferase MazF|nr:type II toxin-antitoxin system PemK/MazF family toxin [Clostridiales Family XIII bacterium]
MSLKQGDLIWIDFDPSLGHEPQNRRPALIVSNDDFNRSTSMRLVVPITSNDNGFFLHEPLPPGHNVEGFLIMEQLRALDVEPRNPEKVDSLKKKEMIDIISLAKSFFDF